MQIVPGTGKRKHLKEALDENPTPANETQKFESAVKRRNISQTCIHEVAVPDYFNSSNDELIHGSLNNPIYDGLMAKKYPFKLDSFQRVSIACLERNESIFVSAHTSAGKTAVAEYAIAMSFRDNKRVIYTSPLKALSNQKYRQLNQEFLDVGLMTGDVTLSPHANCLVMTTEVLRGMLYRGTKLLEDVAWIIFDEIHYMNDRERGVVWEESIIFLPPTIKMVFLSATMSNAIEFAEWICKLHKQPCHVVYTDFRPTPLYHYVFPVGGSQLYLVVDENEQIKEDRFPKLQETFKRKASRRIAKRGTASARDIFNILKIIMRRKLQPVIIFSFSRWGCERLATSIAKSKLDFNSDEEKDVVEHVFKNAILCLSEKDRNLPAIRLMLPPFQRGIAVHHSGLLPIIKELVELLFQEGLIKALFATETFAMGLNMPAKTVVFTSVRKWDGVRHRYIGSGEYIQMSGRAGRRGKDERGISIIMINEKMKMDVLKDMVLGKPAPLVSTFRLSYHSILNLLSRAEGQFTAEHVIKNSFHQFQYEKSWSGMNKKISKLETEVAMIESSGETEVADYHNLELEIAQLEKKIMSGITRSTVKDMRIKPPELTELLFKIKELKHKLAAHPLHELQKFRDELKNRLRVLERLGHIDADSVVQLKGRAARLINTGDELLVTELMFNGTFNDLDPHQVVAFASCFIPGDKPSDKVFLRIDLAKPLQKLQESARKIAEIQRECQLDINVEKYVESAIRPYLIDVIYCWSKGATFAEVISMTDIFEGSIIRLARQLDVFLNQLKAAAHALGDINLEKKFESGIESLRHGIMFTNSLYL
ncbi:DEAD-box ATP-dependent RNA helicase ISE2, chloroplastic [Dendrobium catenatum]|uniref:DEAD-box ATP-dependent RNA helicase ISE2, chloroplastic n=1 Tax=Dendrobium catenatum TaxID=906689 RepID=A0A2I0VE02_9ASPA|nr:DEAD-box ATP-dependent RNA helicase ISE2, chloroplastic [Dendrobium catenatum]